MTFWFYHHFLYINALPKHLLKGLLCCRSDQGWRGCWQSGWHLVREDPVINDKFSISSGHLQGTCMLELCRLNCRSIMQNYIHILHCTTHSIDVCLFHLTLDDCRDNCISNIFTESHKKYENPNITCSLLLHAPLIQQFLHCCSGRKLKWQLAGGE